MGKFTNGDARVGTYVGGERAFVPSVQLTDADGSAATIPVAQQGSSSATVTAVDSGIASVSLLAANTDRRGAIIMNSDANVLYVDLSGGTASATNYSASIAEGGTYEVPFGYTGGITGIWAADGTGAAHVTEFE